MNDLRFSDRQLRDLLLPLVVEQALVMLVGMADTVMVSKLGDAAVSGVSLVDQICNVIIALLAALATGGAVVASQMIGANRRDDACRVSNQLVLVVSGVALAIMVPVLAFRQQLLSLMFQQVEPDVMSNALTYLEITAISYPFIAIYNAGTALYRSMNRSNTTMKVSMLVNVINIGGNALFVYGLGSGVEGVAIPTLVSRMTGAVCMMLLLRDRHLQLHLMPGAWKPNLQMMKHILGIGIPNGLENSLFQLGRLLVVGVITAFGTVQITANAVANVMDSIGVLPGQAMNLAIITVVGQCVGAGDYKQARYYIKKLLLWAYIGTWMVNIPLLSLLRVILPIFKVSGDALNLAWILIMMHNGVASLLWPLAFVLPNALRAASDVKYTMVVAIASMALFRILFSYILGLWFGWGAIGVWLAMILDWICRLTCFILRYRGTKWEMKAQIRRA